MLLDTRLANRMLLADNVAALASFRTAEASLKAAQERIKSLQEEVVKLRGVKLWVTVRDVGGPGESYGFDNRSEQA
jgi:hypothetical protein